MLIILLNQFYPPDVAPTGVKLHDLAKYLVKDGNDVVVITSKGSYNGSKSFESDVIDKVRIVRVPAFNFGRGTYFGKILDYLSFFLLIFFKLSTFRPKPDVVVAMTTPPYLGIFPALLFGRRSTDFKRFHSNEPLSIRQHTRIIHWIMDLYPDVINAHGMLSQTSLIFRLLEKINRIMFMRSDKMLALGPSMVARLANYVDYRGDVRPINETIQNNDEYEDLDSDKRRPKIQWIPLWGDSDLKVLTKSEMYALRSKYGWKEDDFVLMHAGNLGLGVRLNEFIEAARRLGKSGPIWAFFGGGKKWTELIQFAEAHKEMRLELYGYVPKAILNTADVHLISLMSSWTGVGVPSKIQNIFSIGKPAIFVGDMKSEIALWILESGGGWVVREGDVDGLLASIESAKDPEERARRGRAAYFFAEEYFNQSKNCERISKIILA